MTLLIGIAAAFPTPHTSREPLPARENERSVTLPKGWSELELAGTAASARSAFDADGEAVPLEQTWTQQTLRAGLRYGVAPGWEIRADLPWMRSDLERPQMGFGTAAVGVQHTLDASEAPFQSLGLYVGARTPIGFDGGSLDSGARPLVTGTTDLVVALDGRLMRSGILLRGRLALWKRFGGVVGWSDAHIAPGDRAIATLHPAIQAGPLLFGTVVDATAWGNTRSRSTRSDPWIPTFRSAGGQLRVGATLVLHLTRGVELELRHDRVLAGEDDTYFGLEELHPARFRRTRAGARIRW